jgi:hypothetical protein
MDELVPILVATGRVLAVMGFLWWLASRVRHRASARDALQVITGAYDTMYRPTADESHYEIQAQAERKIPFSSPDEPWRPAPDARRPRRRRPWAARRGVR